MSIEIIFGPMFSGKSSELLRKVRRFEHAKKQCLVINYAHDNRYSNEECMSTHDKIIRKAIKSANLMQLKEEAARHDVVAIDEGQFFPEIVDFAEELANKGVIVIIAALDSTFQRKPFGNIINLLPLAEKVTKLSAVCVVCAEEAAFTQRTVDNQEIELIGGQESYKPVCRKCFFAPPNQTLKAKSKSKETELSAKDLQRLNNLIPA